MMILHKNCNASLLTILFYSIIAFLFTSCDLTQNKVDPNPALFKVFESSEYDVYFQPISVAEASDGGYLILGEIYSENNTFSPIFLMKIDKDGKVLWHRRSTDRFNPCSKLIKQADGSYYFVAMQDGSFSAVSILADSSLNTLQSFGSTIFPLAAEKIDADLLIMGYNTFSRQTTLTKTSESGSVSWTAAYDVFEDVQENITNHLLRQRPIPFPFYIRNAGPGHYAFNGLNNFTLAHTYVSKSTGAQTGVINGVRYLYGTTDFLMKKSGRGCIARHKGDGNLVFTPDFQPNVTGILASKDIEGIELPEASAYSPVVCKTGNILGKEVLLMATNTKSGQIMLQAYAESSGTIIGSRYIGANTLYTIGDIVIGSDGSIIVVGVVQSAGRFGRIFFNKLNQSDIKKWLK